MSHTSVHEQVREIASVLDLPFELRANNTLISSNISDNAVTALIEFLVTNETAREVRYMRRGRRLMSWTRVVGDDLYADFGARQIVDGRWEYREIVMWDDTFKPYVENKIGRIETPAEYHARRRWEGEQYRVGSNRSPMDSAHRVTLGASPMEDYWNK
jgi:hypothetical protein